MFDSSLLALALPLLLQGAVITLQLTVVVIVLGLPLGLAVALLRLHPHPLVARLADGYAGLFRGTPMLVQLFIIYYGFGEIAFIRQMPQLWWFFRDALNCAILALVLNTVAYTSEVFRTAFLGVPRGQIEAALAVGMNARQVFFRIRLPLAFRQALPVYGTEAITVVKETSLASTITVLEITGHAKRLMSQTFAVLEIFVIASAFYLAINLILLALIHLLERRLRRGAI